MRNATPVRAAGPSPWWLLLLAILPAISFATHFRGLMVLGWDSEPSLRPELALLASLTAWNWHAYLGQPNVFQISQAPLALLYWLLSLPLGVAGADQVLLTALFVLPAFTMYYAARRIFARTDWLPFVAAWCYALSPMLFVRYYVPIMTVQLVYAMLPLLVNVWVDLVREGATARRLLWLALVEIAMLPTANNLAYWLAPHLTAFLFVVLEGTPGHAFLSREQVRSIVRAMGVTVLINAFWLVPVVLFGLISGATIEHEAITKAYTSGVRNDVAQGSSLSYSLRMSSRVQTGAADFYGTYWTYARALENGLVAAPYFLWIVFSSLAVALRPRDRRVIALAMLLCFALFIMKGESPPFAIVLHLFYQIPLLGTIFRNGNDKFIPTASFAFALLMPIGAAMVVRGTAMARFWRPALIAVVLAMAFPYWTGQMFLVRSGGPSLASIPPPDAFAFTRALDSVRSRVLFLPVSYNPQLLSTTWGFYGPNVYGSMTSAGFVAMPASLLNVPGADELTTSIHDAIQTNSIERFVALTRDAGIGYVMVAHDMDPGYYGGVTASRIDSFLGKLPGTSVAASRGNYTLWKLDWVGDVARDVQRRDVIGYDTAFEQALLLSPKCGGAEGSFALVPLDKNAACSIDVSVAGTPDQRAIVYPARAWISGRSLIVDRPGSPRDRATVALPPSTDAVVLESRTVQSEPVAVSLQPCTTYGVQTYVKTGGEAPEERTSHALPAPDAAYVPLPAIAAGTHVLSMNVTPDGSGASASLGDAVIGDTIVDAGKLHAPRSAVTFQSMPGRSYNIALGAGGLLLLPRTFVRSFHVDDVRLGAAVPMVAPPWDGTCPAAPTQRFFHVRAPTVTATVGLMHGSTVVSPWDVPPGITAQAPLPSGDVLVRYGDEYIGTQADDELLPTGGPVTMHVYRAVGPRRPLALVNMSAATAGTVSNGDSAAGTAALAAPTVNERWMKVSLPTDCAPTCVVTVRVASIIGNYGLTVTDAQSNGVIVSQKEVHKPELSIGFHAEPGVAHDLYVYTEPATDATASALQIASMSTVAVQSEGTFAVSLPRIEPAHPADFGAIAVNGGLTAGAAAPTPADRIAASDRETALVLDTQFDPFWTTIVLRGGSSIYWPQHVQADGYKNAWLIPPGVSGTVVHFYLLDALALAGAILAACTTLALLIKAR